MMHSPGTKYDEEAADDLCEELSTRYSWFRTKPLQGNSSGDYLD